MARKKTTPAAPASIDVDAIRHKDARVNIPTEELRDFVAQDEGAPGTLLYPRDPSLDPQLVWKGKDEQDRQDLAVPVVPIYIQEKIHPLAIVESVRAQARKGQTGPEQLDLKQARFWPWIPSGFLLPRVRTAISGAPPPRHFTT